MHDCCCPRLLPEAVAKVVYLDADTIVRGDVAALWDEDMAETPLFAVEDLPLDNGNAARIARTVDQSRYPYDQVACTSNQACW